MFGFGSRPNKGCGVVIQLLCVFQPSAVMSQCTLRLVTELNTMHHHLPPTRDQAQPRHPDMTSAKALMMFSLYLLHFI